MNLSEIKIGPSIQIQDMPKIMKEREVTVSYQGGYSELAGVDLRSYQVILNFTEEEFQTLQKRATKEGKKITEFIYDYVTSLVQ